MCDRRFSAWGRIGVNVNLWNDRYFYRIFFYESNFILSDIVFFVPVLYKQERFPANQGDLATEAEATKFFCE